VPCSICWRYLMGCIVTPWVSDPSLPHHPEHFKDGVDDMNLLDIMEMFCDWKAAGERHNDGNILKSIERNADRFGLSPQLVRILENTAKLF
jgi:hypothetical protein